MPQNPRAVRAKRRRLHKREAARWRRVLHVMRVLCPEIDIFPLPDTASAAAYDQLMNDMMSAMAIPKEYLLGDCSPSTLSSSSMLRDQEMQRFMRLRQQESLQFQRRLIVGMAAIMQEAKKKGVTPSY